MSYTHWGDSIIGSPDDEYSDERVLGFASDGYCVVGASVRGKMHIRNEVPREDAVAVYRTRRWVAVAVSDGVGSSKYSRLGASFAVNRVCENLLDQIGEIGSPRKGARQWLSREAEPGQEQLEGAVWQGLRNAAHGLKKHAESLSKTVGCREGTDIGDSPESVAVGTAEEPGADETAEETIQAEVSSAQRTELSPGHTTLAVEDLHCTLLALILNLKTGTMALAQVGDGLILGLTGGLNAVPLIDPQVPGQTGQTYVITQKDWDQYCSVRIIPGDLSQEYATVYLMTDGVADDCQHGPPEDILQRWAKDMDSEIRRYDVETTKERLRGYLTDYQAKGSYDDRTLVAVYRSRT